MNSLINLHSTISHCYRYCHNNESVNSTISDKSMGMFLFNCKTFNFINGGILL